MNSQVLIDRELLERLTADPMGLSNKKAHWAACHELREILDATPAPIPDAGEGVEVVAYMTGMHLSKEPVRKGFSSKRLMTVAQHTRIVSALQASAMVVPDGWVRVPVEATIAMVQAGIDTELTDITEEEEDYRNVYRAMIAASPAHGNSQ